MKTLFATLFNTLCNAMLFLSPSLAKIVVRKLSPHLTRRRDSMQYVVTVYDTDTI